MLNDYVTCQQANHLPLIDGKLNRFNNNLILIWLQLSD